MATGLRRDLESISVVEGARPYRIIVDEISGRFARISEFAWQRLQRGDDDAELWNQATAAGLTRRRIDQSKRRISLLSIKIPIGEIDSIASLLAGISGIVFSVHAIVFWLVIITSALLVALVRSAELTASLGSLASYLAQSNPLMLGTVFLFTKVCHELGHAVMCRRIGSRCGDVGVLLLCGMPSPYCDVTNIWRQPSQVRRAAVMLAGIYVELIIASIATFVWLMSSDIDVRMMALNLMIVCSVSTILFNANPLMAYDGYFVLSDLLGSANLRQEARSAFQGFVVRRFAGPDYGHSKKSDRRSFALSAFYLATSAYRLMISVAIAGLIIGIAGWLQLRTIATLFVLFAAFVMLSRAAIRLAGVYVGRGRWRKVNVIRRGFCASLMLAFFAIVLFVPMPRFRRASGLVDAAVADSVYLPENGRIDRVYAEIGETVSQGDPILSVDAFGYRVQEARLNRQLSLAKLRRHLAHRNALDGPAGTATTDHWTTLRATEDSLQVQLASTNQRHSRSVIRAPKTGIIIPGKPQLNVNKNGLVTKLKSLEGLAHDTRTAVCRVCAETELLVALVIDARDRPLIQEGTHGSISIASAPDRIIRTTVESVSEIKEAEDLVSRQSAYQVICKIDSVDDADFLTMIGQECSGVFRLPSKSFAAELVQWLGDWIRE